MRNLYRILIFSVVLSWAFGASAQSVYDAHTEVELVSEGQSLQPGQEFWVALRVKHDPHWHSYWKNPGDSGIATSIEWQLPEGLSAGAIHWPYPEKILIEPLMSYGYSDEVFLLVPMTASSTLSANSSVSLNAKVVWLACEIQCIPGEASLSLTIPVLNTVPKADTRWVESFSRARSALPLKEGDWELTGRSNAQSMTLVMSAGSSKAYDLGEVYFYPYDSNLIDHFLSQRLQKLSDGNYRLTVKRSSLFEGDIKRAEGVLVSSVGWRGQGSEKSMEVDIPLKAAGFSIWTALFFAFLGGLILNLMPCVLPVISLKVLHFAEHDPKEPGKTLKEGLLYTLGILVSFWTLALCLNLFRAAGQQIGWGFHLQSPLFVTILAALFFSFALNLWGVFEVTVSLASTGKSKVSSKYTAAFLSGVITTIVATPCTAPFMGAALGFGLTQPAFISLLIFTMLGLGMALPILLLSLFPAFLKFLPKPGPWMLTLKKVLSCVLFATAAWLLWILNFQVSQRALMFVIAGFAFLSFAFFLYGKVQRIAESKTTVRNVLMLIAVAFAFCLLPVFILPGRRPTHNLQVKEGAIAWQTYSAERLETLLAEGTPVFLDFTAAWCLTCQVNERVTLGTQQMAARFKDLEIVALRADWTARDPEITEALAGYGRTSIPLYVLYGPNRKGPVLLPEIISPGIVEKALDDMFE